jgi:hypothetical protein
MAKDIWGIPIPDAKDVVSYINNTMNTLMIASGDKPALTPGANAVRRSGEAVSYVNSTINPFAETSKKILGQAAGKPGANKALAKSVGIDAVTALTGALAGKVAGSAANAVARSGIVPRVVNKATGQIVVVHGTGRPIVGRTINPRAGSPISPDVPAVSTWNTEYGKGKNRGQEWIYSNAQEYAYRSYYDPISGKNTPGRGNFVIGKTKLKDTLLDKTDPGQPVLLSGKPVKITKVFRDSPKLNSFENKEAFVKELKQAGVKTKANPINNMLDKREAKKLAERRRQQDKNSPV